MLPPGWIYIKDFGVRQMTADSQTIPANIGLGFDMLASEDQLEQYIGKQIQLIEGHLKETKLAGPSPTAFPGAQEAYLLFVRHKPQEVETMLHVQTYARVGPWVGIITLTTPEARIKAVRPEYEAFVRGLSIRAPDAQN